jgi:tetratricopeptide (TPR) repeat protein
MMNANTTTRTARHLSRLSGRALTLATLAATVAMVGCSGHGKYTSDFKAQRQEMRAQMKAMTDLDAAEQRFLAGELEKSLKAVDNSIAINDGVARSHTLRGRILMEQTAFDDAFVAFSRALELEPNNVEVMYYTGLCYERVSDKEKALEYYVRASEIEVSSAQYVVAAAEMLIDLGRIDEAVEFIEARNATFEHDAGVRQTLGHISMIQGEYEKAHQYLDEARILAPEDEGILEDLTRTQIATGRFAEAEYSIAKLQQTPENASRRDLMHMRARCLAQVDRLVEARQILLDLTNDSEGGHDVQAWIELGHVAYVLGDSHRVKQAAARVIVLAPNQPDGYMLRALWQRKDGNLSDAYESLTEAVARSDESDANPYILHGIVAQQLGMSAEATASLSTALAIDPSNATVSTLLTQVGSTQFATVPDDNN